MITTNRLLPLDAFGSNPHGLVHLTGLLQVVARVTLGVPGGVPPRVDLLLDAARVRGMGLETGAHYLARGAYRFSLDPKELPVPLDLVSTFELLGYGHGNMHPRRLLLAVTFHVKIEADGRITVGIDAPKLLPSPSE
jgi:hypothetical protein